MLMDMEMDMDAEYDDEGYYDEEMDMSGQGIGTSSEIN